MDAGHFGNITPSISDEEDQSFNKLPTIEEVWDAIQQLNPTSSPGNDGYTGHVYRACWKIIQEDVYAFILDFFKGAYILSEISLTTLVLIPKTHARRQLGGVSTYQLG